MGSGAGASAAALPRPVGAMPAAASGEPDKEFKCPTCLRVFNKKANLKVHSRKHTGERPYACSKPGCGRSFMWKSSVTFHEQNCPSTKRPDPSAPPAQPNKHPHALASKGVQKRPKSRGPASDPAQPRPAPRASPARRAPKKEPRHRPAAAPRPAAPPALPPALPNPETHLHPVPPPPPAKPPRAHNRAPVELPAHMFSPGLSPQPHPHAMYGGEPLLSPPPPDAQLPAPAVLLSDKRLHSGGGRPPVIPGSLPKVFYGLPKENTGPKALFDLRVPAPAPPASANKPPVMYSNKMPKLPISMELDDSDDEAAVKVIGAQDAFMRTGNPFGGFAPPTRCSPLPVSSPIVCPGISPMPLSPLAPFSPLPPDSPAHNAPNPVHPPLNQTGARHNSNW